MKYYLYEEQDGGCDYTIGCGKRLRLIEGATTMAEAIAKAIDRAPNQWGDMEEMFDTEGEWRVSKAVILEVAEEHVIDIVAVGRSREAARRQEEQQAAQEKEKREYERLRAKFGKGIT